MGKNLLPYQYSFLFYFCFTQQTIERNIWEFNTCDYLDWSKLDYVVTMDIILISMRSTLD